MIILRMRKILLLLLMLFLVGFILLFFYPINNIFIILTFLINLFLILTLTFLILIKKEVLIFNSVIIVFSYVFFFVAPLIQVYNRKFPNTINYSMELIVKTNLYIALFLICYIFGYLFFYNKEKRIIHFITKINYSAKTFYVLFLLSSLIIIFFSNHLFGSLFGKSGVLIESSSLNLILNKFVFVIPIFNFYFLLIYKNKFKNKSLFWSLLIISFFMVVLVKNPLVSRRNEIGPIYLTSMFIIFRKKISSINVIIMLLLVILVFFLFHQQLLIMMLIY